MRDDDIGLFWETPPVIKMRGGGGPRPLPPIPETDWRLPDDYPSLEGQGMIALDVETFDPELTTRGPGNYRDGYICGVSIGTEAGFRRYYPVRHEIGPNCDQDKVFAWLRRELRRPVPKVGANLLYDLGYLDAAGIEVCGPFYDVQIAEPLIDETKLTYSLESLSLDWLDVGKDVDTMRDWLVLAFGAGNFKGNIYRAPSAVVGLYAESDVDRPLRIFAKQRLELERLGIWELFVLESKLIPMLLAMRKRGVRIDLDKTEQLRERLQLQQDEELAQLERDTGLSIDVWSADSLAAVFDAEGVNYPLTEKTGKPSFRKEWLMLHPHPLAKRIAGIRKLDKFRGTFVEGYLLEGHTHGRIHCSFHQLRSDEGGTVSGRFSSSDPNLQNIPIRDPVLGPLLRSMFLADESQRWWKYDWSQIEFRRAIHHAARLKLPGAQLVVEQYQNDPSTDYHQVVAGITGLSRASAKNINFGILYGLGIDALAASLGVTLLEAERMLYDYHQRVPFAKRLRDKASQAASRDGFIRTELLRYRHFNAWERRGEFFPHEVPGARRAFTHKALNAKLQGDAADLMKKAMVDSWEAGIYADDVLGAPHLTVHDELDGSFDESPRAIEALQELKNIMETCVPMLVPVKADGGTGINWGAIK